jgi:hypothetical protein
MLCGANATRFKASRCSKPATSIKQFVYVGRTVAHVFREDELAKPKHRNPSFGHVDVHNLVADDRQADHRQLVDA